jgi:hypothetical protein
MQLGTILIKNGQYRHFQIRLCTVHIAISAEGTLVHQGQQEQTKSHNAEQSWNVIPVAVVAADVGNMETDRPLKGGT